MSKMIRRCFIVLLPLLVLGLSAGGLLLIQQHDTAQAAHVQKHTTTQKHKGSKKRKSKQTSTAPAASTPDNTPGSSGKRSRKTQTQPQTQAQTQDSNSSVSQAAQSVLDQINAERGGEPPLQMSDSLVKSAHAHNLTMQQDNQLDHELSNEPTLGDRISQQGVQWSTVRENIGEDGSTSDPVGSAKGLNTDMFNEQPPDDGHRQNILATDITMIGIDVLVDTQNGKIWLTEDFAG